MAKVKRETTRMKSEINSREGKIAALVANGLGNAAIWAAMEEEYPVIIETGDDRRNPRHKRYIKGILAFDKDERARVSRAINSVRGLAIKEDEQVRGIVNLVGGDTVDIESPDDIPLENLHRFTFGDPSMDFIYGETRFIHLSDASDSKYKKGKQMVKTRDATGVISEVEVDSKNWISGSWRIGDPMIPDNSGGFVRTRDKNGDMIEDLDLSQQLVEKGCPESFISVWGGEYGAGKSRLAIMLGKKITKMLRESILYINGETNKNQFRTWLGHDVDPNLFNVVNADLLPVERVAEFARKLRPRVIFIDSIQTIAEFGKGDRGVKSALAYLKLIKADPTAGCPHIVLISQLNAQGKLRGGTVIPHIADAVAHVKPLPGRKDHFTFEIPRKNRGGQAPRNATFRHTATSVECVSTGLASTPVYKLIQPTANPAIVAGIVEPPRRTPAVVAGTRTATIVTVHNDTTQEMSGVDAELQPLYDN